MVPLSAQMVGLRFTAAAQAAGLERRVTAHSGRVGLASELTSRGASTTDVMLAGNWKTSRMGSVIAEKTSKLVIWVGSGFSTAAGLPTWPQLKKGLVRQLRAYLFSGVVS